MAREIDKETMLDLIIKAKRTDPEIRSFAEWLAEYLVEHLPTLTPPPASPDLISRSALLMGETQPEITTGSDSELAEHMDWDRWMDKVKRAPAVGKEATL